MNDQMTMLPAQLAAKCISSCLRGGLPLVLGVAAIVAGGAIFCTVKGVQGAVKGAKNTYSNPFFAGEKKSKRILAGAAHNKSEVYTFEMDAKFYEKFSKNAKEMGLNWASVKHDGIVHVMLDQKNQKLAELLTKTASSLEVAENLQNEEEAIVNPEANQEAEPDQEADPQALQALQETEPQNYLYKEVEFKESLWYKICSFIQTKILEPLKVTNGIFVDEIDPEKTDVYINVKDKKMLKDLNGNANGMLDPIREGFDTKILGKIEKDISKGKEAHIAPLFEKGNYKPSKLKPLVLEFNKYNTLQEQKKALEAEGNQVKEDLIDTDNYPEIGEMLKDLMAKFAKTDKDAVTICNEINEYLQQEWGGQKFKGSIVADDNDNIKVSFDEGDKNSVINYAANIFPKRFKESEFRAVTGLSEQDIENQSELDNFNSPLLPPGLAQRAENLPALGQSQKQDAVSVNR